jgi:hypothetical protein
MANQTRTSSTPRFLKPLAISVNILVLIVVAILFTVATNSSGDKSTALGFIALLLFIFISMPSLLFVTVLTFIKSLRSKALITYLVISLVAHVLVAFQLGFFDKAISNFKEIRIQQADPALYSLRNAVSLGPISNIQKVIDALNAGADPNASYRDEYNLPLIVLAASRADHAVIHALLEAGANPNAQADINVNNIESPHAIDLVLLADTDRDSALRSLQLLQNAGATTDSSLLILGACYQGEQALYMQLHNQSSEQTTELPTGSKGYNCLHYAVENTKIEFIRLLLENNTTHLKAKRMLDQTNNYGQLPLDLALSHGKTGITRLLLHHGATANKEQNKQTLLSEW